MNLLIADDEMVIRRGLQSLDWASIGISEVYTVQNGVEAQELLLSTPIDLAILDIRMPGVTGLELAAMVKEKSMDTAVVLLTGFSDFEYAREALRAGVYEYMLKPLRPREILNTMEDVIRRLERKRYQAQLVREHEATLGSFDTVAQVHNRFPQTSKIMSEMLTHMASHFDQPITLSTIAEEYHFSINYVSKMFKRETNYSFTEILTAIRMMNATRQLLEDVRVNQVSTQVGFSDQRYFSQVFRKTFGCPPSKFKEMGIDRWDLSFSALLDRVVAGD